MLIDAERSLLLVVDLQAKMVPALADGDAVVANAAWLIRVAQRIGVPVAAVEQYPKGLGPLVPAIRDLLAPEAVATKHRFSCVAAQVPGRDCPARTGRRSSSSARKRTCACCRARSSCVEDGKEVYVVADAVGSRRALDRDVALARMRQEGVRVVTREMVAFEWLGEAGTPLFREINRDFLR